MPFLLSDTVGFIRKLPTHLIESFKSTLDEVRESDLLVHVVDLAHPQFEDHIQTVNQTLKDLEAHNKPTLMLFNKVDLYRERYFDDYLDEETKEEIMKDLKQRLKQEYEWDNLFISALKRENLELVRDKLNEKVKELYTIRYPYQVKHW